MAEVHRSQFEWLRGHADESARGLSLEDRELLAILWARQCGIAPRVLSMELSGQDPKEISRRLYQFRKRMSGEPALAALASIP